MDSFLNFQRDFKSALFVAYFLVGVKPYMKYDSTVAQNHNTSRHRYGQYEKRNALQEFHKTWNSHRNPKRIHSKPAIKPLQKMPKWSKWVFAREISWLSPCRRTTLEFQDIFQLLITRLQTDLWTSYQEKHNWFSAINVNSKSPAARQDSSDVLGHGIFLFFQTTIRTRGFPIRLQRKIGSDIFSAGR